MDGGRCPTHRQRYLHYCVDCQTRICPHCLVGTGGSGVDNYPHLHHEVLTTQQYIRREKEHLLQQTERLGHVINTVDLEEDVTDKQLQLELAWLSYKQRVRQEFVSLHNLLLDREHSLFDHMQKRIDESLESLAAIQHARDTMTSQEAALEEDCLNVVQDKSPARFFKEFRTIQKRCDELCENAHLLPSADDVTPTFLRVPFCLLEEKLHLDSALKFEAFDSPRVKPKVLVSLPSSVDKCRTLRCSDLWDSPNLPPSTRCRYRVEIRTAAGTILPPIHKVNPDLSTDSLVFSGLSALQMCMAHRYMVKVVPVFTCFGCGGTQETFEGDSSHIMVLRAPDFSLLKHPSHNNMSLKRNMTPSIRCKSRGGRACVSGLTRLRR